MPKKKYIVTLTDEERYALEELTTKGKSPAYKVNRLDGKQEAHLIALTCSSPPEGQGRWTLRMLAERMVELDYVETVSHETVRQTLKKTNSSPG